MMYYVYVLKNKETSETYIGYTNNLDRRLKEHKHRNSEPVYYEAYKDRQDARDREIKLKQRGQSTRWLKQRIRRSLI